MKQMSSHVFRNKSVGLKVRGLEECNSITSDLD